MSLRSRVIKLAHAKPDLRPHLLPLLVKQAGGKIPSGAPRQVKEVAKAAIKNAMEAAEAEIEETQKYNERNPDESMDMDPARTRKFWKERVYVHLDAERGKYEPEKFGMAAWEIADNYDRGPSLFYYPETDTWTYMRSYGTERAIKGGFREALANAEIMYTG